MQPLYKPKTYPLEVRQAIYAQSSSGVAIANRWLLGWPKRVEKLLEENQYVDYLTSQVETEREALLSLSQQDWGHLAQHEKLAMMEISPAPPMI